MKKNSKIKMMSGGLTILAAIALIAVGCRTSGSKSETAQTGEVAAVSANTGAQLWAQNCNRCHNFRSPGSYSDAQWDIAMHHMRIRANLTAEEHRNILEFLKSAN